MPPALRSGVGRLDRRSVGAQGEAPVALGGHARGGEGVASLSRRGLAAVGSLHYHCSNTTWYENDIRSGVVLQVRRAAEGGVMQVGVGVVFFIFVVLWTGALWWIATRAALTAPYERVSAVVSRLRRWGALIVVVVLGAAFILSLPFLPYPTSRAARLGSPQVTVEVTGRMWAWELSQKTIPRGQTVEFVVRALDVNHGFGIYAPDGRIVTQVQAMPGYTNRLLYRFDEPGTYTIRCLEFCATGHHLMVAEFTVE